MFESSNPDAPVFDRLFPGYPRQRLSDSVLRHQGKFTALQKDVFHDMLSDLARRLTKKLKLKLLPVHMTLLAKKLSAAINYKLRKSSKANAKKSTAPKPTTALDASPSKATGKKTKKPKKSKPSKATDEIVFVPSTQKEIEALAAPTSPPQEEVSDSKYLYLRSTLPLVKRHLYLVSKRLIQVVYPIQESPVTPRSFLEANLPSEFPPALLDSVPVPALEYFCKDILTFEKSEARPSCPTCNTTKITSSHGRYYCDHCEQSPGFTPTDNSKYTCKIVNPNNDDTNLVQVLKDFVEYISVVEALY
jgi:hypothetical protein